MDIVACCSFKGGTAKTSTVLHLGVLLAKKFGKKILLVDFDSQANLSTGLGFSSDTYDTMASVLQGGKKSEEVIQRSGVDGLDIICGSVFLDGIEATSPIVSDLYGHERLRNALRGLDYDFIFIDTPPSLGWLTQSAFLQLIFQLFVRFQSRIVY